MEELNRFVESEAANIERNLDDDDDDPESNGLHQHLLKRNRTLSSNPLAIVGTKVSHIESLDYE